MNFCFCFHPSMQFSVYRLAAVTGTPTGGGISSSTVIFRRWCGGRFSPGSERVAVESGTGRTAAELMSSSGCPAIDSSCKITAANWLMGHKSPAVSLLLPSAPLLSVAAAWRSGDWSLLLFTKTPLLSAKAAFLNTLALAVPPSLSFS